MPNSGLSNNNISSSAPPPPPPLPPAGWVKNCRQAENNDKNEKTSGSIASENSSRTEPKKGQSKSPVQQLSLNFADSPLFKQKQAAHANSETADEGSNIRQSEKNRSSTPKTVFPRVLSPQQDNGNQHSGVQFDKDKPGEMKCESKNQKSSLAEQKKATGLKYSIAILLLCTSGAVAGVCTYFMISAVLSGVAVPVFFAVIASVSTLVMLISAAYLINSHLSAINNEKKVNPGRKQSQDLQKAKRLEHSNTHTSSPPVALRTSSVPTLPTLKNNTTNKSIPSGGGKQQESGDLMAELSKAVKKRKTVVSGEDSAQQRNNEVCQNQPQYSDLQKAKELEHSNTPTSSLPVMSGTPSAPPPPPPPTLMPVKPNTEPRVTRKSSLSDTNQKDVQQKQSDTPVDARSNLLAEIRQPRTLKKIPDEKKNYLPKDSLKIPQKQEEESVAEKRENGVQTLNQSQKSYSQAAKKLEHSNSDTTTGPIRKVESQKTDKEPSNSESMQQGDYMNDRLKRTVLGRRKEMYCQYEQLDSLEERDDSLYSLEGSLIEPNNTSNKELKNPVQRLNASIAFQNIMFSTNSLLNSPSNNLLSNSGNVPDDEDWETQPHSIPYINLDKTRQEMRQEKKKESDDFFTTTKVSDVNSEMQYPSTLSIKEYIALFDQK